MKLDGNTVVFEVWDNAFALTVDHYLFCCTMMGCDPAYLDDVRQMIKTMKEWREADPNRQKKPGET